MSFNSFLGFFFALGVVVLCWWLPQRVRNVFLLIASFTFYAYGDLIYSLLLGVVILVGFVAGRMIESTARPRLVLGTAILILLGVLGVFKYFNFFAESFAALLDQLGLKVDAVTLMVLLPIGISFYTFQTISYLIDVFRKDTVAERSLVDFALFISFFPQLVAGPIERSNNLLLQVKHPRPPLAREDIAYGFFLIVQGYAKKIVIADTLGPYADLLFQQEHLSAPLVIVGLLFFAFQIYGDFSGYTDIARGYSRLLGFRIILNFNRPYWASDPSDFWRRWHISLSSWFTEYVYFPLGGNRSRTKLRRWGNVMATLGLSGLWHGAAFNFVVWGLYHGLLIIMQRGVSSSRPLVELNARLAMIPSRILTFLLVLYGWMYFRVESFEKLGELNRALVFNWDGWFEAALLLSQGAVVLMVAVLIDVLENYWLDVHGAGVKRSRGLSIYLAALIVFVCLFATDNSASFIYFRF